MNALLILLSALLSGFLTWRVRAYALRHQVMDHPNERSSHSEPTPRGGGLAIVLAIVAVSAAGYLLGVLHGRDTLIFDVGLGAIAAIGWVDDVLGLRASVRLSVHFLVAAWTLIMLHGLPSVHIGSSDVYLGVAGYVVGTIGIVWSINLFNFMDGIDGIAGSQAALIFGIATPLLFYTMAPSLGLMSALASAAAAGFLVWNWPPAKIFMGDVGSGALGYLLAALALASERRGGPSLLVFVILYGVFIFDATVTLARRIIRGAPAAVAHRDHVYQRLARSVGMHRPITLAAAAFTLCLGILGSIATLVPALLIPALVISYALMMVFFVIAERRAPM